MTELPAHLPDERAGRDRQLRARVVREAITVPSIFLTVVLAGGFRATLAGDFRFVPPPLVYLLLALLLVAVLVRSSVLVPAVWLRLDQGPLAPASAAVLVVTTFAASAQLLNILTPAGGLLHVFTIVLTGLLLANLLVMAPAATRALQSLFVTCGGLLLLKFVMLAALANPEAGFARRLLTVVLEGATLGELQLEPLAPLTGYVAFAAYLLYFVGLVLLKSLAAGGDRPVGLVRIAAESQTDHVATIREDPA